MPYKDGTGPTGQGTNAGRNAGRCAGQGGAGRPGGRGLGGGRGRGLGRGTTAPLPALGASQDHSWIGSQLKSLQAAIQGLTARLDTLDKH
ncbi:DUF5320 domain-containing protein [uncultured Thiodictyon sp.]|uniref:DUF5320 domain-containing protein n=1 Tax=uncultured Thiodictyon sp. TaxID=1846217 RepID=UPI003454CFF9